MSVLWAEGSLGGTEGVLEVLGMGHCACAQARELAQLGFYKEKCIMCIFTKTSKEENTGAPPAVLGK